jgi:hypothetical protein
MVGLRHVLAPYPRAITSLTPSRVALATVAAITAAAALPVVDAIPDVAAVLGDGTAPRLVVLATTSALGAAVGNAALGARTHVKARMWLAAGAAAAGALATWVSYLGVVAVRGGPMQIELARQILGSVLLGGILGFVFGTAFAPLVVVTRRALFAPSHDGEDRVLFTAGASLLAGGVIRTLLSRGLALEPTGALIGVAGTLATAIAAARIVARVRLIERARQGTEPGFHVVPRSGAEDEAPLLPLVRTRQQPAGVLAATGVSAPYRGARGIFKLGLAPLPDQRFDRPIAALVRAAIAEGATCITTLAIGGVAFLVIAVIAMPILLVASALASI